MIHKFRKLFKESFIYSTGNIIVKVGGFIVIPLYLQFTSIEIVGLIALFEVMFQLLLAISGWGVKGGFQRWYYEFDSPRDRKSLFFTCYAFNISSTLWASLIVFGILWLFSFQIFNCEIDTEILLYFCLATFFRLLLDIPYIILKLKQKVLAQTMHQSLNTILMLGFTYWMLKYQNMGFKGIFLAQLAANVISFILLIPEMVKNTYFEFRKSDLKEMIRFGVPLVASNLLAIVFTLSDRYIINQFYSLAEVGSFSLAYKISTIVQFIIIAPFITSYSFDYYKNINKKVEDQFHLKSFTMFVYFMVFTSLALTMVSKEVLLLLSKGETAYYDAIPVIPLLLFGLVLSGMRQIFQLPLAKAKNSKSISIISIFAGIINFALNLLIVPVYGKIGAAIATAFAHLVAAIWFYRVAKRYDQSPFEVGKIVKSILIGFILAGIYLVLPLENHLMIDIAVRIAFVILYFLLLYWMKCFEAKEIEIFKGVWHKWKNPLKLKENLQSISK